MTDVHLVDVRDHPTSEDSAEVLLAGWSDPAGEALADALRQRGMVARPVSVALLPAMAAEGGAAVLALGPELDPDAAADILDAVTSSAWVLVTLGAGASIPETVELLVKASEEAAPRELEAREVERHTAIRGDMAQLFRGEALAHYQRGRSDEGHLLEIEPVWMRLAYGVILALLAAALLFFALAPALRGLRG